METVVDKAQNYNERAAEKHCNSASQSPKQMDDDSVVYKLVRVQGDGRFVPATEDEVKEVKDLLEVDGIETHGIEDTEQSMKCNSWDEPFSGQTPIKGSVGLMKSQSTEGGTDKANGRHEDAQIKQMYIEEMFQKVHQEEKLLLACGSPDHSPAYMNVDIKYSDNQNDSSRVDEKVQPKLALSSPSSLCDSYATQSMIVPGCSNISDEPFESISCASAICTTSKLASDGEISLENLSIRELHKTFKATFGRETTVKDKQWLKRRIAMGLSNSCDVSTTSFIFINNKWTKKVKQESSKSVDSARPLEEYSTGVDGATKDSTVAAIDNSCKGLSISLNSRLGDRPSSSGEILGSHLDYSRASDDLQSEERAAKRVRKPTKRYIEEVPEVELKEFPGKLPSLDKDSGQGQTLPMFHVRQVRNVTSDEGSVVARTDSLGGSGVQIPYVSRNQRSRPSKNVSTLTKFNRTGATIDGKLVKKALGVRNSQSDEIRCEVLKAIPPQKIHQPPVREKDDQCPVSEPVESELKVHPNPEDSIGVASDDNIATEPTAKGGMRRKHHRAWTISEVMKLVEGVSRYGTGRWSEIKRISFASYSHRTSVDLKDKWRNLLRASFAQTPPDNGMNSRKPPSTPPIPTSILRRVRELAELQLQVPPIQSSGKMVESIAARNAVHEPRPGYL